MLPSTPTTTLSVPTTASHPATTAILPSTTTAMLPLLLLPLPLPPLALHPLCASPSAPQPFLSAPLTIPPTKPSQPLGPLSHSLSRHLAASDPPPLPHAHRIGPLHSPLSLTCQLADLPLPPLSLTCAMSAVSDPRPLISLSLVVSLPWTTSSPTSPSRTPCRLLEPPSNPTSPSPCHITASDLPPH